MLTLMYHGIVPEMPGLDPTDMGVLFQDEFERHLRYLKRAYAPLHADEFVRHLKGQTALPKKAVLVTLDDGYQNILDYALPVAEVVGVPLLVFVASGHLDAGEWLWFSRLHALRMLNGVSWREYKSAVLGGSLSELTQWLEEIGAPERAQGDPLQHMLFDGMRSSALRKALEGGYLSIGGHTVNHPRLSMETRQTQIQEIVENKKLLESITGKPIHLFAYPEGFVSNEIASMVKQAGYLAAFLNTHKYHPHGEELPEFLLPRSGIYRPGNIRFWLKCWGIDALRGRFPYFG